ncbi:MAG: signal peptidase I [Anaerolineales bacterium]|nr:MAG: signal peptidase I [Anaerolineales bacterium]
MEDFRSEIYPDQESAANVEKPGGLRHFLIDVFETVLLSLLLFLGINAVSARIRIESVSMQPTLYEGDFVIVNKLAYNFGEPSRGDVIVFRYPPDPEREPYIKRVIGLPGDRVSVQEKKVLINNEPMLEPYISAPPLYEGTWIVPEGSLFVLGDNRNSSSDSHSWGMVPFDNVIGKAEVVYWPPEEWKLLNQVTAVAAEPVLP